MAYALNVDIIDGGDGTIKVSHTFWGLTKEEVRTYYREHLESCDYFRSAKADGRVLEELEEIDESDLPDPDGDDEDL